MTNLTLQNSVGEVWMIEYLECQELSIPLDMSVNDLEKTD